MVTMQAIILCGGLATRLGEAAKTVPEGFAGDRWENGVGVADPVVDGCRGYRGHPRVGAPARCTL